jgi:hypothetical protein
MLADAQAALLIQKLTMALSKSMAVDKGGKRWKDVQLIIWIEHRLVLFR